MFTLPAFATGLLGLSPAAGALAGFLGYATAVIQHANMRTPRWLGYFLMRPTQHGLHHARGIHSYNFGNFALWDILGAMLVGRDVAERV